MRETRHRRPGRACRPPHGGPRGIACALGLAMLASGCQFAAAPVDPARQQAELSRGVSLLRAGRYPDAYQQFTALRPLSTRNPDALNGLAIAADMTGNRRQASQAYAALADVTNNQAVFFNNRGYSRMLNGELQEAYSDLTRAASLAPDNAKIAGNLRMLRAILPRRDQF